MLATNNVHNFPKGFNKSEISLPNKVLLWSLSLLTPNPLRFLGLVILSHLTLYSPLPFEPLQIKDLIVLSTKPQIYLGYTQPGLLIKRTFQADNLPLTLSISSEKSILLTFPSYNLKPKYLPNLIVKLIYTTFSISILCILTTPEEAKILDLSRMTFIPDKEQHAARTLATVCA